MGIFFSVSTYEECRLDAVVVSRELYSSIFICFTVSRGAGVLSIVYRRILFLSREGQVDDSDAGWEVML